MSFYYKLIFIFLLIITEIIFILYYHKNVFENYKNISEEIDVIILSYNRPHNLKNSLLPLITYNNINKIYVYHGNPEKYDSTIRHSKIKHVKDFKNNDKMKTLRRFYHSLKVKSKYTLMLDDDFIPSNELIDKMLKISSEDDTIYVGNFKRLCSKDGYFTNDMNEYNTILTGLSFAQTKVFQTVWKEMKKEKTLFDLVVKQDGNCEDLLFNYVYQKVYKKNAYYVSGEYRTLDTKNGFSTTNTKEHYELRNNFCKLLYS